MGMLHDFCIDRKGFSQIDNVNRTLLQDDIGRMSIAELSILYVGLDQRGKSRFAFAVLTVCDFQMAMEIWRSCATRLSKRLFVGKWTQKCGPIVRTWGT